MIVLAALIIAAAILAHGALVGHSPAAEQIRERVIEKVIQRVRGRTDDPDQPSSTPIGL